MAYAYPGDRALDYCLCRYGTSKLLFRGPRRDLERDYCAVLGGTETFGKFVPEPYPALIEADTGLRMVNLGCMNAGLDVYLNDPAVLDIARRARITVLQIIGAQNLSNRFYAVHPRRNDRFVRASPQLVSLFRTVDFTEFNFTRHMLQTLQASSPDRFELVVQELRTAWVARMKTLLSRVPGKSVLLWFAAHHPPPAGQWADLRHSPLLIDQDMLAAVRPFATAYVEAVSSPIATASGTKGMVFGQLDAPAASALPGTAVHRDVAASLAPVLENLI